jgi:hypothetical protein
MEKLYRKKENDRYEEFIYMTKKELNREIGYLVGNIIVKNYLPTLSTDMLQTNLIIDVSEELTLEWEKRNQSWLDSLKPGVANDDIFYDNLEWYRKNIQDKYLEDEIVIRGIYFNYSDKEQVIEGIKTILWDSDLSHYQIDTIEGNDSCRTIKLKRG